MPNEFGDWSSSFRHQDGLTAGGSPDELAQPRLKRSDPDLHHGGHIVAYCSHKRPGAGPQRGKSSPSPTLAFPKGEGANAGGS